tara:strand:- start:112 stop:522 length:411 start_codon:yes stop_codon:yes gene_type:complete
MTEKELQNLVNGEFTKFILDLNNKINGVYSNLTFTTIDEIIKDEVDLKSLWWELSRMNDKLWSEFKKLSKLMDEMDEELYDEYGYRYSDEMDDMKSKIEWKIMSIQSLIDKLEEFDDLVEENDLLKRFSDIKQIEI